MNIKQWFNRNSNEQEQSERYRLFGATATKKKRVDNNPTYVADNPNTSFIIFIASKIQIVCPFLTISPLS